MATRCSRRSRLTRSASIPKSTSDQGASCKKKRLASRQPFFFVRRRSALLRRNHARGFVVALDLKLPADDEALLDGDHRRARRALDERLVVAHFPCAAVGETEHRALLPALER